MADYRSRKLFLVKPLPIYEDDDDEYEKVADAFDEYLDQCEFDEVVDGEE